MASTTQVTRFAYDGQNVWADLDGTDALVTRRLFLDSVDSVTARISASGTVAWYLTDRLGSVRVLTDASGAVIDRITYDGFGNIIAETNPSASDRYLWTGREFDRVTGLQYNRARYYDPTTGRWTSEDPFGFAGGYTNLYVYVGNNPTNAVDPFGANELPDPGRAQSFQSSYVLKESVSVYPLFGPVVEKEVLRLSVVVVPKWMLLDDVSGSVDAGVVATRTVKYIVKRGISTTTEREIQAKIGSEVGASAMIEGVGASSKVTSELAARLKYSVLTQEEYTREESNSFTITGCAKFSIKVYQKVREVSYTAVLTNVTVSAYRLVFGEPITESVASGKYTIYSDPPEIKYIVKTTPLAAKP